MPTNEPTERACDSCGEPFVASSKRARFCGAACRQRAHRRGLSKPQRTNPAPHAVVELAAVVAIPRRTPARAPQRAQEPRTGPGATEEPRTLVEATLARLREAGRLEDPNGIAAVALARHVDNPGGNTGASVAALVKAHREALAAALAEVSGEPDALELARESAARKMLGAAG